MAYASSLKFVRELLENQLVGGHYLTMLFHCFGEALASEMTPHKCRVVLVDDHEPMRKALRVLLASFDDVELVGEASDGEEAIQQVASCQPDVILLDIRMPKMNGIEAANVIRKSWKDTVIIGLCLVDDTYTTEAFLKAGALAVVSKERLDDLHSTIQRACVKGMSAPGMQ